MIEHEIEPDLSRVSEINGIDWSTHRRAPTSPPWTSAAGGSGTHESRIIIATNGLAGP